MEDSRVNHRMRTRRPAEHWQRLATARDRQQAGTRQAILLMAGMTIMAVETRAAQWTQVRSAALDWRWLPWKSTPRIRLQMRTQSRGQVPAGYVGLPSNRNVMLAVSDSKGKRLKREYDVYKALHVIARDEMDRRTLSSSRQCRMSSRMRSLGSIGTESTRATTCLSWICSDPRSTPSSYSAIGTLTRGFVDASTKRENLVSVHLLVG